MVVKILFMAIYLLRFAELSVEVSKSLVTVTKLNKIVILGGCRHP